ncbi:MAG: HPP family protein [Leptothrix sp. (in: b-proteobacteria)]
MNNLLQLCRTRLLAPWRSLWPAPLAINATERWRIVLGAGLGLLGTAALSWQWLHGAGSSAWLVAPLGASTVLVFALPASPLAQPWSVVGGNTLSALVGIACAAWLPWPVPAAALAVALAIALMLALRCLHPPGGAAALLSVLGHVTDWHFAVAPVLLNSALLVLAGVLYNQLTGRAYPHAGTAAPAPTPADPAPRFSEADLDQALRRYNQVLDVPRDDLRVLLEQAELQAWQRRLQRLHCGDIMRTDPVSVMFGSSLQEAWTLLQQRQVKALPVVDRYGHVVGIVTLADVVRAAGVISPQGLDAGLRRLLRPTPAAHSDKPEVVGQVMTRQVRVVSADRPLAELVPIFSSTGHHHLPVIGADNRLVGMVTQTELIAALLQRHDTD